jgi:hypothetical protein
LVPLDMGKNSALRVSNMDKEKDKTDRE